PFFSGLASVNQGEDLVSLAPSRGNAAAILAFRLCLGDAFQLPRQHDASFELCNRAYDLKHKLAGRIVRVEIHIQNAKGDAFRLQPISDFAQMPDRARQAVNFRDHQCIAFARKLDCRFKLFAWCDRADVLAEQFLGSRRFQIPYLRFKTGDLFNGRSSAVANNHKMSLSFKYMPTGIKDMMACRYANI